MHNYIILVYRVRPNDINSISGLIEEIESGQKEPFHSFNELQALLAKSIGRGQLELPDLVPQEAVTHEKLAVVG